MKIVYTKKAIEPLTRKHGFKASLSASRAAVKPATRLSFERRTQCYLWLTDRGRQRLIKH